MKPTDRTLAARELRRMSRVFRSYQRGYPYGSDAAFAYSWAADDCLARARELENKR